MPFAPLTPGLIAAIERVIGPSFVRRDRESLEAYGVDALKRGRPADLVVLPASTEEIAGVVRLCNEHRVPVTPRGGGTGYTGGAVPVCGGVVLSLERLNRILRIDDTSLFAVVEPNVITADFQEAVERVGLFYPPDPASLKESVLGGNVAENAGGPRAFKYGVTTHWVLGLEAVLPTGEIVRTNEKTVKNVVGYDLTHLLVGSEGRRDHHQDHGKSDPRRPCSDVAGTFPAWRMRSRGDRPHRRVLPRRRG
jgi:glycolate oxidase